MEIIEPIIISKESIPCSNEHIGLDFSLIETNKFSSADSIG